MADNDATSLILKNADVKQRQDEDLLSTEDLAWADSCLVEDSEISETEMDSLKSALLDILDLHSRILGPSENELGESNDVSDPMNFPSLMEEGTSYSTETSTDEHQENEFPDVPFSIKQPFLPNYNDEMMMVQYSDDDKDEGFSFSEFAMEPLADDIFKVWDLDIPVEEDVLVKQLKEALSSNAATRMKVLKAESLDSLVESIADLSLK